LKDKKILRIRKKRSETGSGTASTTASGIGNEVEHDFLQAFS
jgi:hypothetical protein